jgi:hypothetical protein
LIFCIKDLEGKFSGADTGRTPTEIRVKLLFNRDNIQTGEGSAGIRVDGWNNMLNIERGAEIHSDGRDGTGLMVCYGKEREIRHEGIITALGEDGIAVRFDFGDNLSGNNLEYWGSFIHHGGSEEEFTDFSYGEVSSLPSSHTLPLLPELEGALVKRFDVCGRIMGRKSAIYMSRNAYVNTILVRGNAGIEGDIISDWNPGAAFVRRPAGEDLHPKLYFGGRYDVLRDEIVGDEGYNRTLRGNIRDNGNVLEVNLLAGRLQLGDVEAEMTNLARFHMHEAASLQIGKSLRVNANQIVIEEGARVIFDEVGSDREPAVLEFQSPNSIDIRNLKFARRVQGRGEVEETIIHHIEERQDGNNFIVRFILSCVRPILGVVDDTI